jgi:hypothetical protein
MDGGSALPMGGAQTIGAGVAAADDDDGLALGGDEFGVGHAIALAAPVLEGQVLHRVVDAAELAPGNGQVARRAGAAGEQERVEGAPQLVHVHPGPHVGAGDEGRALGFHLPEPAVEHSLLHFELWDAVTEEAPDTIGPLEDGDGVAGARELLRGGEARGARSHDGHALAREGAGRLRSDPALLESAVDDGELDGLDGHRIVVDPEHAGALAGRRAQGAGELGEVVGGVQAIDGLAPSVPVDEVVPVRDQVAERTAPVAEGDPAVHAAGALLLETVGGPGQHDLAPVPDALLDGPVGLLVALELDEAGDLAHRATRGPLP